MWKFIDMAGHRQGRLLAIKYSGLSKEGSRAWLCFCDCGNKKIISYSNLINGRTVSCGCYIKELQKHFVKTHGFSHTSTYRTWCSMKTRCLNKNFPGYKYYGGRGITICEQWMRFENFLKDMGERPKGNTLDRIDNNKGYSPENCRWATMDIQMNNTSFNKPITFNGETLNKIQWVKKLNLNKSAFYVRFYRGWDVGRIFNQPYRQFA